MSIISNKPPTQGHYLHPVLLRVKVFLNYEDIYSTRITHDELVKYIALLPTVYWIKIASMGSLFLDHYQNEAEYQGLLLRNWLPDSLLQTKRFTKEGTERFFFHQTQFRALFRLALLHSNPSIPMSMTVDERKDVTARCLLGINSLLYDEPDEEDEKKSQFDTERLLNKLNFDIRAQLLPKDKEIITNLLQIYHDNTYEFIPYTLGRFKDMLFDISSDTEFVPQGVPRTLLSDALKEELGLTMPEYAALTIGLLSKYVSPDGLFKEDTAFPVNLNTYFSKTSIPQEITDAYLRAVLISQSEFIKLENETPGPRNNIRDFRHFMQHPLVRLDGSIQCYPTSLTYLKRLLDIALPWVISGGTFRSDVRNYWGQCFECYCRKICQRIASNSIVKPKYFPALEYGSSKLKRESCDAILIYGNAAVMLEFKIKSPTLTSTIMNGGFESFLSDINDAFISSNQQRKAAAQIDETIRAIRNGNLKLPGIQSSSIKIFFPVLVTLQPWPLGPVVYNFIRRTIKNAGLLRLSSTAELEIWSCEELESIEALLAENTPITIDMPSIIKQKIYGQYKDISLKMFFQDIYTDVLPRNQYVLSKKDEILRIVSDTLSMSI